MYFHNVVGTGSYTTSTTNMYHKDRFHVPQEDRTLQLGHDHLHHTTVRVPAHQSHRKKR